MGGTKNKSVSKKSRILLLIGFAFFINPIPMGLDLLPDVFGCALIYFGLTQTAYFDGSIEEARKSIFYLLIVEAVNLLMMESVVTTEISSNRLLAVTAFSIIQALLYIMFFRKFFGGIEYFSVRNNHNQTLAKCDSVSFISYLAFFVRIAATLLPELLATIEVLLYAESDVEIDFDTLDIIADIVSAKPVLVVMFSMIALGTGIAWFVSLRTFIKTFYAEAGEDLDIRYAAEYTSKPEKVLPNILRRGNILAYTAIFFAVDFIIDGIRIIPASFMFLFLFVAAFMYNGISGFRNTKKLALPAFLLLIGAEVYRMLTVPYGAIIIYETDIWIVAVGAVIGLLTATVCMLCVRGFLFDLRKLTSDLGLGEISTKASWVSYCVMITLWSVGFIVPYFYSYVSNLRFFAACIFIWQTAKIIGSITDAERERRSLYGN